MACELKPLLSAELSVNVQPLVLELLHADPATVATSLHEVVAVVHKRALEESTASGSIGVSAV